MESGETRDTGDDADKGDAGNLRGGDKGNTT